MTKPNLGTMLTRYNYNRELERKNRKVADLYETEIIKILISQFIEKGEENE